MVLLESLQQTDLSTHFCLNEDSRTLQRDTTTNHLAESTIGNLRRKKKNKSRDPRRWAGKSVGLSHRPNKCLETEPDIFALNPNYWKLLNRSQESNETQAESHCGRHKTPLPFGRKRSNFSLQNCLRLKIHIIYMYI